MHDATVLPDLLHGKETRVWGDRAYQDQREVIRKHAPCAKDFTNRRYRYRDAVDEAEKARNRTKSKVRAKVEHSIGVIKRVFGFTKVRYRGLDKNAHRLFVTSALANLFIVGVDYSAPDTRSLPAVRRPSAPDGPGRQYTAFIALNSLPWQYE